MCLICVKPKDGVLCKRELRESFRYNDDGAGFMFAADGKLHINKGFFGFRRFYKAFRSAERSYPDSTFVLHFRLATHGAKDTVNCHPFFVHPRLGFCHNGVMNELGNQSISDSAELAWVYLHRLPDDFPRQEAIWAIVEDLALYTGSKFAFLDAQGQHYIAGENKGHWLKGVWYSNYSYLTVSKYPSNYGHWYQGAQYEPCAVCGHYRRAEYMYERGSGEGKRFVCTECFDINDTTEEICTSPITRTTQMLSY